jgi:hypothetical protein
MQSFL